MAQTSAPAKTPAAIRNIDALRPRARGAPACRPAGTRRPAAADMKKEGIELRIDRKFDTAVSHCK
ncbi:MAG: hypothetical protein NT123_21320 [Proteobacteria bacterium]|nr:hypothetical protein [Pseudomonadota bacterium]